MEYVNLVFTFIGRLYQHISITCSPFCPHPLVHLLPWHAIAWFPVSCLNGWICVNCIRFGMNCSHIVPNGSKLKGFSGYFKPYYPDIWILDCGSDGYLLKPVFHCMCYIEKVWLLICSLEMFLRSKSDCFAIGWLTSFCLHSRIHGGIKIHYVGFVS